MEVLLLLLLWAAFGVIGALVSSGKGRSGCAGFALGVLLGPIGVLIAALQSRQDSPPADPAEGPDEVQWRNCRACGHLAVAVDGKCRACGHEG